VVEVVRPLFRHRPPTEYRIAARFSTDSEPLELCTKCSTHDVVIFHYKSEEVHA